MAQWIERLPGVLEVMGSIPVGISEFFFVPGPCRVDYFIFITELKIHHLLFHYQQLTSNVKYDIVGKLCDTTNLKATAVNSRVSVTLSRSEGEEISTENEQKDNISIRNCKKSIKKCELV